MAGRGGKGRGKASMSFDVSRLGFSAGEGLPKANIQPPPLYPPLNQRPTPLLSTEVDEYLLALSQEYRGSIRDSPFYLKPKTIKRDIVRYTDRYKQNQAKGDATETWTPDWNFIPGELKPAKVRKLAKRGAKVNVSSLTKRPNTAVDGKEVLKRLEVLEKTGGDKGATEGTKEDEQEVVYEEDDDFEEENDYNFDYYNDGGDKYGDDEDGEEGPVY